MPSAQCLFGMWWPGGTVFNGVLRCGVYIDSMQVVCFEGIDNLCGSVHCAVD
jgi:hypothetical protein